MTSVPNDMGGRVLPTSPTRSRVAVFDDGWSCARHVVWNTRRFRGPRDDRQVAEEQANLDQALTRAPAWSSRMSPRSNKSGSS